MWAAVSVGVRVPFVGLLCCFWLSGLAWADETADTIREEGVESGSAEPEIEVLEETSETEIEEPSAQAIRMAEDAIAELEYRYQRAVSQNEHARSFFGGETPLDVAFPQWTDRPIVDLQSVMAAQLQLNARISARAVEWQEALPQALDEPTRTRWTEVRRKTLEAEDLVDVAEQRLLGLLQRGLEAAPELRESNIRASLERIAIAREAIGELNEAQPDFAAKAEELNQWSQATAMVHSYRRAAIHRMTSGDGSELHQLIDADLAELDRLMAIAEPTSENPMMAQLPNDFGRIERISWVKSFLKPDQLQAFEGVENLVLESEQSILLASLRDELSVATQALESFDGTLPTEDIEQLGLRLEQIRQEREQLESKRGDDLDAALEIQIQIEQAREALAGAHLDAANRAAEAVIEESATTQQELQQAQERAEEARRLAEEAREQDDSATAALREQVLQFSDKAAEILLAEVGTDEQPGRSPLARQRVAELQDDLDAAKMKGSAALGMAPLEPGRQQAIDDAWSALRRVVDEVRKEVWTQYEIREQIIADLEEIRMGLPDPSGVGGDSHSDELVEEWHESLSALHEVMAKQEQNVTIELDAGLELLTLAKAERREIRRLVSPGRMVEIQQSFISELLAELREFPLQLESDWRSLSRVKGNLGGWFMDLSNVGSALWVLIELFALLGAWLFLRRPCELIAERYCQRLQLMRDNPEDQRGRVLPTLDRLLEHGDYSAAAPIVGSLARDALAIAIAGMCLVAIADHLSLLALALMAWQVRNIIQFGPRFASLAVAGPGQLWPCWRRVTERQRMLTQRTVWIVCVWFSVEWLFHGVAIHVMDADRIDDLVDIIAAVVGLLLGWRLLAAWAEHIRKAVERRGHDRFTPVVANAWRVSIVHPIQALAGLIYLFILFTFRFGVQLLGSRRGLSWLTTVVMRKQLSDKANNVDFLDESQLNALGDKATLELCTDSELQCIQNHYLNWTSSRRRGLVALTGDRGSGKSRIMDRLERELAHFHTDAPLPVQRIQCPSHRLNRQEALQWMNDSLRLELEEVSQRKLISALSDLSPRIIAVDDLHQVFRRSVGGFSGLVVLLDVMFATSEEHFWLTSMHEPAWAYLQGVPGAVNLSVFRDRVALRRWKATEVRLWLEQRVANQGFTMDYGGLVGEVLPGADRERAVIRSRDAFWRLLVQSAQGNPRIILLYWLRSLRRHSDSDKIEISLFDAPDVADLKRVGDMELFVLTALILPDGLSVDDISAVLNLSLGQCRSLCRQMESHGILRGDDGGTRFSVELNWLPAVERLLQQKHFLYAQT